MQPNPVDTTNVLLAQLVQTSLNGSSVAQPMIISSSTGYSSSDFWTQALAYTSLAFSLLAAFGAVLGKQWLGYYKTNRYVRGSLEERCKQRHRKFQGLEKWWLEKVLGSFPDLLKFSLFLFGLSLGAAMWSQQQTISTLIIITTASGVLFYALTIVASVLYPDCPFQTRVSPVIRTLFYPDVQPAELPTESAMGWLLSTSTNPDVIKSALELLPIISGKTNMGHESLPQRVRKSALELLPIISGKTNVGHESLPQRVRDMFRACFNQEGYVLHDSEDSAVRCGKALVHLVQTYPEHQDVINQGTCEWNPQVWISWRALFLSWALKQCQTSLDRMANPENAAQKQQLQADTRSALRMAVSAGLDRFTHSDDMDLVHVSQPSWWLTEEHRDCLIGCLGHFRSIDDDATGDALLLLLGNCHYDLDMDELYRHVQAPITSFLTSPHPRRLRHIALRFAIHSLHRNSLTREESFCHTVFGAIFPPLDHIIQNVPDTCNDSQFADAIALLKSKEWPKDSDLRGFPLRDIQLLVLFALPVPRADNLARYTPYCNFLAYHIQARGFSIFDHMADTVREDLAGLSAVGFWRLLQDFDFELLLALLTILDPTHVLRRWNIPLDNAYFLHFASILAKVRHHNYGLIEEPNLIGKCIRIMEYSSEHGIAGAAKIPSSICLFYLAGIVLRVAERAASYFGALTIKHWWDLIKGAWHAAEKLDCLYDDPDDILAALVTGTLTYMPLNVSRGDLEVLCKLLGNALDYLGSRQPHPDQDTISAVRGLKDEICCRLEATGQDE
jgi:hypothetical protein